MSGKLEPGRTEPSLERQAAGFRVCDAWHDNRVESVHATYDLAQAASREMNEIIKASYHGYRRTGTQTLPTLRFWVDVSHSESRKQMQS